MGILAFYYDYIIIIIPFSLFAFFPRCWGCIVGLLRCHSVRYISYTAISTSFSPSFRQEPKKSAHGDFFSHAVDGRKDILVVWSLCLCVAFGWLTVLISTKEANKTKQNRKKMFSFQLVVLVIPLSTSEGEERSAAASTSTFARTQ